MCNCCTPSHGFLLHVTFTCVLGSQGQKPLHTYGLMNISVAQFCSLLQESCCIYLLVDQTFIAGLEGALPSQLCVWEGRRRGGKEEVNQPNCNLTTLMLPWQNFLSPLSHTTGAVILCVCLSVCLRLFSHYRL